MSNPDGNFPFRLMILPLLRKKNIIPVFLTTRHRTDIPITEPEEPEPLRKIPRCMPTGRLPAIRHWAVPAKNTKGRLSLRKELPSVMNRNRKKTLRLMIYPMTTGGKAADGMTPLRTALIFAGRLRPVTLSTGGSTATKSMWINITPSSGKPGRISPTSDSLRQTTGIRVFLNFLQRRGQ